MAETLTESFCERCGTRYEFQAPTRLNTLRKKREAVLFASELTRYCGDRRSTAGMNELRPYEAVVIAPTL